MNRTAEAANPQSAPAMTFSRPTSVANRAIRSAISSGCSTRLVVWLMTPGMRIFPSGTTRVEADQLRGLRAIDGLAGLRRRILVYRGPRRMATADGIDVWPVDHFLAVLASDTLWP